MSYLRNSGNTHESRVTWESHYLIRYGTIRAAALTDNNKIVSPFPQSWRLRQRRFSRQALLLMEFECLPVVVSEDSMITPVRPSLRHKGGRDERGGEVVLGFNVALVRAYI